MRLDLGSIYLVGVYMLMLDFDVLTVGLIVGICGFYFVHSSSHFIAHLAGAYEIERLGSQFCLLLYFAKLVS